MHRSPLPLTWQGQCHLVPRNAATSDLETHATQQTAPIFSTDAPVRVRPPTSLNPETQMKAEALRSAKSAASAAPSQQEGQPPQQFYFVAQPQQPTAYSPMGSPSSSLTNVPQFVGELPAQQAGAGDASSSIAFDPFTSASAAVRSSTPPVRVSSPLSRSASALPVSAAYRLRTPSPPAGSLAHAQTPTAAAPQPHHHSHTVSMPSGHAHPLAHSEKDPAQISEVLLSSLRSCTTACGRSGLIQGGVVMNVGTASAPTAATPAGAADAATSHPAAAATAATAAVAGPRPS